MQFKEGTHVFTSDGKNVGVVHRFVLDPRDDHLVGVVVRKGRLFTEDKVVPINMVSSATEDRITLLESDADLNALPEFRETHFIPAYKDTHVSGGPHASSNMSMYAYPPLGFSPAGSSDYTSYDVATGPQYLSVMDENIPAGTVTVKEGVEVLGLDGEPAGTIQEVFFDKDTKRISHVLISKGHLFKAHKLIPANWVDVTGEDQVSLTVSSQLIESLPDYSD